MCQLALHCPRAADRRNAADRVVVCGAAASVSVLQNCSGADPLRAIEVYGQHVLPALRG